MYKLAFILVFISIGLIKCNHFDVKGGNLKGPSFWSSYKAKVVELPSPIIEHVAPLPVHQRLILEEKTVHQPIQERLVIEEKIHHVEQPKVIEQIRVEEGIKGHHHETINTVLNTKSHHQNIVLTENNHHDHHHHETEHLVHERRHEELNQQREQRKQLSEIQHFQQIQQQEQIKQQLEQQKHLEIVAQQKQSNENCEKPAQIVQSKTNEHIEQIVQQKQQRNEKLTDEEEAIAEPFPLIPKTSFTCDDKPVLPGMYADLETGCRVYHFCFASTERAKIIGEIHQDKIDALNHDVHHVNSLLVELPKPEQQQMKSFFCGEGTLFNQRLLVCDHAVNVICSESAHYYSANLEFGKASPEPVSKTNNIVQVRENIIHHPAPISQVREKIIVEHPAPVVQVRENIVQLREPVKEIVHHDAIKIVEAPKHIVQVRENIVEHPAPVVQIREKIVQHSEPARISQEQVKIGHLVEEPVIVQQRKGEIVHQDRYVTTTNTGSFASASNQNWKEDRSWRTSRTVWGNLNNSTTSNSTNSSESRSINEDVVSSNNNSTNSTEQSARIQTKPVNRRFLGEQIFKDIPETDFSCEGKPFENGMYADIQTGCKIYHQCLNGRKSTMLCAKGTLFNQKVLSCDFEEKVKCSESEKYYTSNIEFN